jgi:hypothetical protein
MIAQPLAGVAWSLERDQATLLVAVGLGACVAASHFESAVEAFAVSPSLSAALATVGLAAAAWAVRSARRPSPGVLLGGAAAALALVALWLLTRAIGLPLDGTRRAPVGVLDALTAVDELLLAGFAVAAARSSRRRHPPRERWPLLGCVAISLSCVVLAMGCEPPDAPAAGASAVVASPSRELLCHLY